MRRPILYRVLLAIGGVILAVAALLRLAGCSVWLALEVAFPGFAIVGAVLVERWRYKPLESARPGPDWIDTGERFLDPETGKLVTVFYKPATGERRYVGR
jgi:membrane protein implicated in regulation of membrane protease activity